MSMPVPITQKHEPRYQAFPLALCMAICLGAAALGGLLTNLSLGDWYAALAKPTWTPPNWLFGPVWTLLFIGMAVAAWLVWSGGSPRRLIPLGLFAAQLFLNVSWSALFFGLRNPSLAFADVVLLWLAILATILSFTRVSYAAAALLMPYLAWVTYAAVLNAAIWRMNL